jgi:hypothetical protein
MTGANEDGEQKPAPANTSRIAERPMMVYVTSPDATNRDTRKFEDVVLKSEAVAIGAKFFDCVRISEANADQDRILAKAGRGSPRLVFLNREYEVSKTVTARSLSSSRITKAMKLVVKESYENNFDKMVKAYVKLLTRRDGLESVRQRLADKKNRLAAKPNASKLKKLERDQKKYDEDMAKWRKDEQELLTMRPKKIEPAAA